LEQRKFNKIDDSEFLSHSVDKNKSFILNQAPLENKVSIVNMNFNRPVI